jgi:hypothetical protein
MIDSAGQKAHGQEFFVRLPSFDTRRRDGSRGKGIRLASQKALPRRGAGLSCRFLLDIIGLYKRIVLMIKIVRLSDSCSISNSCF